MQKTRLFVVGGGSGGHVTPILPIIEELNKTRRLQVDLVVDKGFYVQAKGIVERSGLPIRLHTIASGRLRRYAHFKWHDYLRHPSIMAKNGVDLFRTALGYAQSLWLLKGRPDAVFAKGGFVSLPFGLAAKTLRIPLVIHDSDARPGLTNQVLSRLADRIATGTTVTNYPYNPAITRYTGVPISSEYRVYSNGDQRQFKQQLGFDPERPLVVATGGGLGAQSINEAMLRATPELLAAGVQIYQITGRDQYSQTKAQQVDHPDYKLVDFVYSGMVQVLAAADLVVSRASATTIQELAGLAKAAILIPARQLGDQIKNAMIYEQAQAAVVLDDDLIRETPLLTETILALIHDPTKRHELADKLHDFARPDAAREIAQMLEEVLP